MTDNMEPTGFNPDADTLAPSELRVVLVCDVVESVRWMGHNVTIAFRGRQLFSEFVVISFTTVYTAIFLTPSQRS